MKTLPQLATSEAKHTLISKVSKSFKHYPSNILSLDTDTDDGLELFAENHQLRGIVTNKDTIATRKIEVPTAKFYSQSLTGYRLPQKMQLTYMLDQKINTLVGETKRQKLINKVFDNMEPFGIFIFDIYMLGYFEEIMKNSSTMIVKDDLVSISSRKEKKGVYNGRKTSFIKINNTDTYKRKDHIQSYQTFSLTQIKKLFKDFDELHILDHKGRKQHKKSNHLVIAVQKGR